MRIFYTYIEKSTHPDFKENCVIGVEDPEYLPNKKGKREPFSLIDFDKINELNPYTEYGCVIGLGYEYYKDELDYKMRGLNVVKQKLVDVGIKGE